MGSELNKAYSKGIERITQRAAAKVKDPADGAKVNLRVARDVLWNGGATEEEVCAEYLGGLLASSRSSDGADDSVLNFVDCIKALSSKQLHLHYAIYHSLQRLLLSEGKKINPAASTDVNRLSVCFSTEELLLTGINPLVDLNILHRQGLLNTYKVDACEYEVGKKFYFSEVTASSFGIMLFAAAHNELKNWLEYHMQEFSPAGSFPLPILYADTFQMIVKELMQEGLRQAQQQQQ
jgi:hypothetical protein